MESEEEFEEEELEEKIYNYSEIEDGEQNYNYASEAEESSNLDEMSKMKDLFSNLTNYTALLKIQLKSNLPNTLNAMNISFITDKDITFKNSNCIANKLKPILPSQYSQKEFPMPSSTKLPLIVYYDTNLSSYQERSTLAPITVKKLNNNTLSNKNLNSAKATHEDLHLLYVEVESEGSSDSSIEWEGATYDKPKENGDLYDSDADDILDETKRKLKIEKEKKKPPSVIYLYDINGNIYLREDKVCIDPRGYISLGNIVEQNGSIMDLFDYYYGEEIKKKNIFNIGHLEKQQYKQLQDLLAQNSMLFAWEAH
ncbi:hypothetical protein F8M41_010730 [Gigaspora margarita]|uniref:Uncharacterized protein n=1 Tax=Gigaspora margarita TaxID=4874 RepID=A0A8H4AU87_GIGMA|nr:hypothetical protein F8M41_010730 [Gigaspora margarita]